MSYESYLQHHGIKGMHWGIRRYRNSDGTLTDAGRKRYLDKVSSVAVKIKKESSSRIRKIRNDDRQFKKKRHDELKKAYMTNGKTEAEAEKIIARNNAIRKAMIVTAGVAVATLGATALYRKYQGSVDHILKEGTKVTHIGKEDFFDNVYVSTNKHDATKYKGIYAFQQRFMGQKPKEITATLDKGIKVAGNRSAFKTFKELYKDDAQFRDFINRSEYKQQAGIRRGSLNVRPSGIYSGRKLKRMYENFSVDSAIYSNKQKVEFLKGSVPTVAGEHNFNKFKDALQKKGYGGVIDLNDNKISGFKTNKPVMLFNSGSEFRDKKIKDLPDSEIMKNGLLSFLKPEHLAIGVGYGALETYGLVTDSEDRAIQKANRKTRKQSQGKK